VEDEGHASVLACDFCFDATWWAVKFGRSEKKGWGRHPGDEYFVTRGRDLIGPRRRNGNDTEASMSVARYHGEEFGTRATSSEMSRILG
jgi:hypothetical protein